MLECILISNCLMVNKLLAIIFEICLSIVVSIRWRGFGGLCGDALIFRSENMSRLGQVSSKAFIGFDQLSLC